MRVDFYQLSRDPAEAAVAQLAHAALSRAGERMLVVSDDETQLARISEVLWAFLPESFLASGRAGEPHAGRQPVLLSHGLEPENGAAYVLYADGVWREPPEGTRRVFLLFGPDRIDDARGTWRMVKAREGMEQNFWRQEGGKWVKAG
ncbi:MAG: DNA polymerase III subunit chi [Sphingomonadales bacterium]|nr:DNA polymerase III subunit chi [Sphingomonadales bacterium]MDE2567698.1 DNA polymerase III subunit chi [Sphingomonadales bacterium]